MTIHCELAQSTDARGRKFCRNPSDTVDYGAIHGVYTGRMIRWCIRGLCLLALLGCAPAAWAQSTGIHRCIGAHGEPVFSGQPCANPVPSTSSANPVAQENGFGSLCAGSPQLLRTEIARAFATRDVNRLAGLILWRGMGEASVRATLGALSAWVKQPLAGIVVAGATGPPPVNAGPAPTGSVVQPGPLAGARPGLPTGFEISTGGGDGSTRDFGITEIGGCWWLTF